LDVKGLLKTNGIASILLEDPVVTVPLATLAALGLVRMLKERPGLPRWIGGAAAVVLASFALEFAAQKTPDRLLLWVREGTR
jgi:drug/metabolite transporter (DMT)-like permease